METATKLWYLDQFDLFKELTQRELMDLANIMVHKQYKKDEPIMFPYNSRKLVYMLKNGSVKIGNYTDTGEENLKYLLNAGFLFGEMALVDGNSEDFAIAVEDCTVCSIRVEAIQDFMMRNRGFNASMYKLIGLRLRKVESKMASLIFKDSQARIVEFLNGFANDFGKQEDNALLVKNLLTNKEIAKLTFTSRQTVNSTLNKLKRNGNIDFDEKYIRIFDLQNI
jgi:CRP-like cAMP-binding protein